MLPELLVRIREYYLTDVCSAFSDDLIAFTEEMRIHDLMDEPDSSVSLNSSFSSQVCYTESVETKGSCYLLIEFSILLFLLQQAHILQKVQEVQSLISPGNPQCSVLRRTINKNRKLL